MNQFLKILKYWTQKYKINMGYSGWDKGQLEDEIKTVIGFKTSKKDFIFDIPDKNMWEFSR